MSVKIYGSDIFLTRGDTLRINISIRNYTPVDGDYLRFAMKKQYGDDFPILLNREIPIDTMVLQLDPIDTKDLIMGETYVYDIELTKANGDVDTFIAGTITIENEVC